MCWWWHTTHVNILNSTLNNTTNVVDVVFASTLNSPTLQSHNMGKRKWNINTSTTIWLPCWIFYRGDQILKGWIFTFTSKQIHIFMEMITMFYHKGVYVANERGHNLLNEATMRNITRKIVCTKIICKERKLLFLKAMYDSYLKVENIINNNSCWCSLHHACGIYTILTILMPTTTRFIDSITKWLPWRCRNPSTLKN